MGRVNIETVIVAMPRCVDCGCEIADDGAALCAACAWITKDVEERDFAAVYSMEA